MIIIIIKSLLFITKYKKNFFKASLGVITDGAISTSFVEKHFNIHSEKCQEIRLQHRTLVIHTSSGILSFQL